MQNKRINSRNSNIELLRILAMIGVIILHYNNAQIGGAFNYASSIKSNTYILYMLECIFISAVNVFILVSGYYMCSSTTISISKPFQLIIQVIFFRVSSYITFVLIGKACFTKEELRINFMPVNYFVILYATLYILSPFINFFINRISIKSFTKLVIILLILFSFWPTIVDFLIPILNSNLNGLSSISMYGSQYGYTIVNFIVLYILGAYIAKSNIINRTKPTTVRQYCIYISLLLLCWITLFGWAQYNLKTQKSLSIIFSYCNPIVIASAIITFILFIKFRTRNSKLINILAKGSFTVFLAHTYFFDLLAIDKVATRHPIILISHITMSCAFIYIACWILSLIYGAIEKLVLSPIYRKFDLIKITCE